MLITLIVTVAIFLIYLFSKEYNRDNHDLTIALEDKFKIIIQMINNEAYSGLGEINKIDKRELELYKKGANQIIIFSYGTGSLTIEWKYKYFQKEIVNKKTFPEVRNISIFDQQKIADMMISNTREVILSHQNSIISPLLPSDSLAEDKNEEGNMDEFEENLTGLRISINSKEYKEVIKTIYNNKDVLSKIEYSNVQKYPLDKNAIFEALIFNIYKAWSLIIWDDYINSKNKDFQDFILSNWYSIKNEAPDMTFEEFQEKVIERAEKYEEEAEYFSASYEDDNVFSYLPTYFKKNLNLEGENQCIINLYLIQGRAILNPIKKILDY